MKKNFLSAMLTVSVVGCSTAANNNDDVTMADYHSNKCNELAGIVISQDSSFVPLKRVLSILNLKNSLHVKVENVNNEVLTCTVQGVSYTGYAIAYNSKTDLYLAEKYSGSNDIPVLNSLSKRVLKEKERLEEVEIQKAQEKKKKEERDKKASIYDQQVNFCWKFGKKYKAIVDKPTFVIDRVVVIEHWADKKSTTCVNSYLWHWTDSLGNKRVESFQEKHIISKATGKFKTIPIFSDTYLRTHY